MTPYAADEAVWEEAGARQESGWVTRAVLVLFSFSVAIDALALPGVSAAVLGAGLALVLASLLSVASTRSWRPAPPALRLSLAYVLWTAVTLLWARDLPRSLEHALTNAQLVVSLWAAWQITRSRLDVRAAMAGFVLGCAGVSVGAWRSFLAGLTQVEMKYGSEIFVDARYVALGFDPNDMGLTLALGLLMAGYLGLAGEGRRQRLWLAYLPLALSAIALSGSRGAAFAAAIALAVVLWWIGRKDLRALLMTLALLAGAGAAVWVRTPETWERIFTMRQQLAGGSLGERLPIWRAGWDLVLANPVLGVGVGGFAAAASPAVGYRMVAHNTPLSVAAETGLVGLALFFGALASIAWGMRRATGADRELVLALLLTWLVGVAALTWEYRKTTWLLLLVGAALRELAREDAAVEPR